MSLLFIKPSYAQNICEGYVLSIKKNRIHIENDIQSSNESIIYLDNPYKDEIMPHPTRPNDPYFLDNNLSSILN